MAASPFFALTAIRMASSLFALIDDIASLLDDVALMTKVAAQKTAGVVGDDLALNARQLHGLAAQRELPVVWAVARGSLRNKAILVPLALALSMLAPWAITPLLMLGGAYLCIEGFEKLVHSLQRHLAARSGRDPHDPPQRPEAAPLVPSAQELRAHERLRVQGAIRTDLVLSGEIIVITLGTVQGSGWLTQRAVLAAVAVLLTVGVYGLVAAIVKLDDLGLYFNRVARPGRQGTLLRASGWLLLLAAPWLMHLLAVVGTVAMFMVGGAILAHGVAALPGLPAQLTTLLVSPAHGLVPTFLEQVRGWLIELLWGLCAGALLLLPYQWLVRLYQRWAEGHRPS